jgi:hypothetical protein
MKPLLRQDGFTILEAIISFGIALIVVLMSTQQILNTAKVSKVLKSKNRLSQIEERIRHTAADEASLNASGASSSGLKACLNDDGKTCNGKETEFVLKHAIGAKTVDLSGSFDEGGKTCTLGIGCIKVTTRFQGQCRDSVTCDQAHLIVTSYDIYLGGELVRTGAVPFLIERTYTTTAPVGKTAGCDAGEEGTMNFLTQFNAVTGAKSCQQATFPVANLGKVPTTSCNEGEVLVGIDAARKAICEKAVASGGGK